MIAAIWRGLVPYADALAAQRAFREQVIAGECGEALWALEHPPVITLGRRVVAADTMHAGEVPVVVTERGGLATWHGPGQLVVYAFVDTERRGIGARRLVGALEAGVVAWLATRGVFARGREDARGVWVDGRKICSIGLHLRRGVSMHGLALNLCPDLSGFGRIVPCGLVGAEMCSLEQILGSQLSPEACWQSVCGFLVESIENA